MSFSLSADQKRALKKLHNWAKKAETPSISLGGYAGTGKTTLIGVLRKKLQKERLGMSVAFASFTGKASQVLRSSLEEQKAFFPEDSCGTIHSLLYSPNISDDGELTGWVRSKKIMADMIVIDEASMVTKSVWLDLCSFGKPILVLGDHGQLPPIGGDFNLMENPDILLEKIHRQAKGNPIIALAQAAREQGYIKPGKYAKSVIKFAHNVHDPSDIGEAQERLLENFHDEMLVLCGRNSTRVALNQAIRLKLGHEGATPESGEQVVCLKNFYGKANEPIYNGMVGKVVSMMETGNHWYDATIDFPSEGRHFDGRICRSQFNSPSFIDKVDGVSRKEIGERFDFGYALTVHKAQGGQARTVVLFEERFRDMSDEDWKRWLYTAITRARENLYIFGS